MKIKKLTYYNYSHMISDKVCLSVVSDLHKIVSYPVYDYVNDFFKCGILPFVIEHVRFGKPVTDIVSLTVAQLVRNQIFKDVYENKKYQPS